MVQLQCKNLVMLSRSAESYPGVMAFAQDLEELGCKTFIRSCDVADESSLARVLQECRRSMPPIRGVVQGAMALHVSSTIPGTCPAVSNILLGFSFRTHDL